MTQLIIIWEECRVWAKRLWEHGYVKLAIAVGQMAQGQQCSLIVDDGGIRSIEFYADNRPSASGSGSGERRIGASGGRDDHANGMRQ